MTHPACSTIKDRYSFDVSCLKEARQCVFKSAVRLVEILTFPIRLTISLFFELVMAFFFLAPVGLLCGRVHWNPKRHDPNLPTLLMIHGLMHNHTAFCLMRLLFYKKANIYTYNNGPYLFWNRTGMSISDYANDFQKIIDKLHKKYGKPVHIVGHSMGCLIGTEAALNYLKSEEASGRKEENAIGSLTLFAPPLQGSPLAGLLPKSFPVWKCIENMRPGSSFLRNLYKKLEARKKRALNIHIIGSKTDFLTPENYTRLPDKYAEVIPMKRQVCSLSGHLLSLYSPLLFSNTLRQRFDALFTANSPHASLQSAPA